VDELKKYTLKTKIICNICNICIKCSKKYYSKMKKICNNCCNKCKRCHKLQLKNNWPEDIIINGKCNKCYHLCIKCDKYTDDKNAFYQSERSKKRHCEKCFHEKYCPSKVDEKHIPITKKLEYGKIFLRWKKTHNWVLCIKCNKKFWNYIGFKKIECKKCKKKAKEENPKKEKTNTKTNIEIINKDQKKKCFNCYCVILIKEKNLTKGDQYYCNKCYPISSPNNKLKYDKEQQKWIIYRTIVKCTKCKKEKWFYINLKTKENICKKCKNISSKN